MTSYITGTVLQQAVFAQLNGQVANAAVYDEVPSKPKFPYITISEVIETSDNSLNRHGRSTLLNIHTWSTYAGNKETLELISGIIKKLDKTKFIAPNTTLEHISTHYLDHQILKEPDTGIRHGVIRFRIFTQGK